jgi:hypothetical protein
MAKGYGEELKRRRASTLAPDEYRELDDEAGIAFHSFRARGKASGIEFERQERKGAALFHIRGGSVQTRKSGRSGPPVPKRRR